MQLVTCPFQTGFALSIQYPCLYLEIAPIYSLALPACGNTRKATNSTAETSATAWNVHSKADKSSAPREHFSQMFPVGMTWTCACCSQRGQEVREEGCRAGDLGRGNSVAPDICWEGPSWPRRPSGSPMLQLSVLLHNKSSPTSFHTVRNTSC